MKSGPVTGTGDGHPLLVPRAAGTATRPVELRAGARGLRDPAVDERAAPGPRTRRLRDTPRRGTGREGPADPAHTPRSTEPGDGQRGGAVRRGQDAGLPDRD